VSARTRDAAPVASPLSILDTLDDPALFAGMFMPPDWAAWRAFLAALFALCMPADALALYTKHTGRATPPAAQFRECAIIIGRRGGKSRVLALIATFLATFRDYAEFIAPGEQPTVALIAADRRQAKIILRYIIGLLHAVPMLESLIAEELAESVILTNGVVIEVHTGSIASPRGRTFIAVLCDEIAFWRSDDSANPDAEVVAAVRPGLASIPNSILLLASSPYAKRRLLWTTFRKHFARDDARVLVWKGSTAEMNPSLDPTVIAEAYEEDPASAAAEYGADFRSDVEAFVSRETVDACTMLGFSELLPVWGISYAGFVDPSGGSADSMTLGIAHAEKDGSAILDCIREVRPPFSPESVVSDFAAVLKSYRIDRVHGDRYAGEWPREQFAKAGIIYQPSERSKSEIYRDALPLLNSGKAKLLDLPRLAAQLCNLERRTSRGGRDSIDHPPGGHDDIANAAAGALLNAGIPGPQPARSMRLDFMSR